MQPARGVIAHVSSCRYSVLGPIGATREGRAVELGPLRRRTVLAALLVDAGRVVPADVLADRVWDGRPPDKPLASVHTYVSRLRSALSGGAGASELVTAPPGYRLAVGEGELDAAVFEGCLARARRARAAGDVAGARDALGEGLGLWRGRAYADIAAGFAEAEADRLEDLRAGARELTVELDLALGRHVALVEPVTVMAAEYPLRERVQAGLMVALYRSGRQADALRHYVEVRTRLAEEIGADPGPELQLLHRRILEQDPSLSAPASSGRPPGPPPRGATGPGDEKPVPVRPSRAGARMVGRDRELETARTQLGATLRGTGPVAVVVVGEAGIGKSRLVEEVVDDAVARRTDLVVGRGQCWPDAGSSVLWPWVQVVRALTAALDPDEVARATAGRAAGLRRLVPDLPGPAETPGAPAASLAQEEVRLLDALTAFLTAVATDHEVLVALEDMHWSDPASRRATEYLLSSPGLHRLGMLLTVRSPSEDGSAAGADLLGGLARTGRSERVTLGGLSAEAVREHVADRTGRTLDEPAARALTARTEGNPFYVGELVRLLVPDPSADPAGTAVADPGVPAEVPDTVREVVLRRVGRLGEAARTVLRTASVLGRSIDLDLLEAVSGLSPDTVDDAVDEATAAGFLAGDPDRPGRHRFSHALVAQAVGEDTGPARRRRWHARAAEALAARRGDDPLRHADRIVGHLVEVGSDDALEEAVGLALARADDAMRRGSVLDAESVLAQALDLAERLGGTGRERREMAVLVRITASYDFRETTAFHSERRLRERALALARRVGTTPDLTIALTTAWSGAVAVADLTAAAAAADELARLGEAAGDPLVRAQARMQRGYVLSQRGRHAEGLAEFDAAGDVEELFGQAPWASQVIFGPIQMLGHRAIVLTLLGREEAAAARAALVPHGRDPNPYHAANAAGSLALCEALLGRAAETERAAARAVELGAAAGLPIVVRYYAVPLAWARARQGPGSGAAGIDAALADIADTPTMVLRPFLLALGADALLAEGLAEAAGALLDRAVDEADRTGNDLGRPRIHRLRSAVLEAGGDVEGARREAVRAAGFARRQGDVT